MLNKIALFLVVIAVIVSAHPRNFNCTISNATYNLLQGSIQVQFNGTHTSFILALTDPSSKLHPSGSGFHVHQYGLTKYSTNCGDAAKHYNPILNYGEISARSGKVAVSGSGTIVSDWLLFEGDYSIVGRSLVIHDNTTTRLACCTIESLMDQGELGWAGSVLKAQFNGLNVTIYNNSIGEVVVNYTIAPLVFTNFPATVSIGFVGDCSSTTDYATGLPALVDASLSEPLSGILGGNFSDWAGRSIIIKGSSKTECAVLVQAATQTNVNDTYVAPTSSGTATSTATTSTTTATTTTATTSATTSATATTAPTTAASTTGNGVMIVFSMVLLVIASLF